MMKNISTPSIQYNKPRNSAFTIGAGPGYYDVNNATIIKNGPRCSKEIMNEKLE